MYKLGEMFSKLELQSAQNLLEVIVPKEPLRDIERSFQGKHMIYDNSFNGSMMRNGTYYDCDFLNVDFCGTNGNNTIIKDSDIINCNIKNANFTYSNFSKSRMNFTSSSTNFDFSDFSDTIIRNSKVESSSFKECYFWKSKIISSKILHSEFKQSVFYNCLFEDMDLSLVTFDFSELINPLFSNVTLPFFGILNLVSGFAQIVDQDNILYKPASSEYVVTGAEYIENIRLLKPVFYYEKNFLALANIYTYDGEIENAYLAILAGLEYACEIRNFGLISHLCRFASINKYFRTSQLKEFYERLDSSLQIEDLEYVEYHKYLNELYIAKRLLIDCPFNRDIIEIELKTLFEYNNSEKLTETLRIINLVLEQYAPESNNHMTVRHNSPADITIILSDNIYILYLAFFALQLFFSKSLNGIEKIQTIIKNKHDIKIQKLEEELKKLEIEKLKLEAENKALDVHSILLPSDFKSISYTVKTYNVLPNELRKMEMSL